MKTLLKSATLAAGSAILAAGPAVAGLEAAVPLPDSGKEGLLVLAAIAALVIWLGGSSAGTAASTSSAGEIDESAKGDILMKF